MDCSSFGCENIFLTNNQINVYKRSLDRVRPTCVVGILIVPKQSESCLCQNNSASGQPAGENATESGLASNIIAKPWRQHWDIRNVPLTTLRFCT